MLFVILGMIVLVATGVLGFLFYLLNKESSESTQKVVSAHELKSLHPSIKSQSQEIVLGDFVETPKEVLVEARLTQEFSLKEEAYEQKVKELEGELNSIATKAQEQNQQALASIDQLKKENEQIKTQSTIEIVAAKADLIKAEQAIESMREEQISLGNRLNESQIQIGKLQDEALAIRHQMGQEISKTKEEAENLVVENETLKKSLEAGIEEAGRTFKENISSLQEENQTLRNAAQDLTMTNQKLKELNSHLIEKSEKLQWELTKARAQMTSFERACENYQNQLQGAFDRSGSIEKNVSSLSDTNNRLQSFLDDLQKQNEELAKREKLFEYELEKNRTQIVSLERDNASLKASIQTDKS